MATADNSEECVSWWDDYKECLKHDKAKARDAAIREEWENASAATNGKIPEISEWMEKAQKKFG